MDNSYVIGLDYGSDSVRAILVDTKDGKQLSESVFNYSRWQKQLYCVPSESQFRQHPKDYIEGLIATIREVIEKAGDDVANNVKAIALDTTGSTPCALDQNGTPLALLPEFEENPNAMFILWKDHTAIKEAEEINALAHSGKVPDYTKYVGGIYSSEWLWAKILRTLRVDKKVRDAAYSWVEHTDWIPALLTGNTEPLTMKRFRCAAGHKGMWNKEFEGLPSEEFFRDLDPLLTGLRGRMGGDTVTAEQPVGTLTKEWAETLGLSTDVVIGGSAFDCHFGAVGGGINAFDMVKVIGTSTCDIVLAPKEDFGDKVIKGICGQVDGSVIPDMIGLEAGQSAFGDVYAWFKSVVLEPSIEIINGSSLLSQDKKTRLLRELDNKLIPTLSKMASKLPTENHVLALDWINGRRTPDANQLLTGGFTGLKIGTTVYDMFKALVDATAFGARAIQDRFAQQGIDIKRVIAIGGISRKSPLVMQTLADVLNKEIIVSVSDQACALGSCMFAAVAAGIYKTVGEAQEKMNPGYDLKYSPNKENVDIYERLYKEYLSFGSFVESKIKTAAVYDEYKELKQRCYDANMEIPNRNLAIYTFGNVSALDRDRGVFAIKPSGVPYNALKPEDMVIVDLDGNKVEGNLNPSSDTMTHAVLYKAFPELGGIVHTHATHSVAWAQACRDVPIYGTTHADHISENIPVTEVMNDDKINGNYEEETGYQILDIFKAKNLNPKEVNMVLVACHGPFTWGKTPEMAVYNAAVLEELCKMATITEAANQDAKPIKQTLINKHYQRKHGKNSYYGQ
ncbi:ribulokinase [Thiospirochaeta perfilievii]|uniref:L-ribulose-5-phosphate 4-epimerase n=1 Tax=Thiospirochaeta perfilievii TaxID=252967 RepID=A0A5C1Q7M2_9SPIO|nr:ribulokinase [Thiospirochaeta perfilievii]QEN03431.1 ribulokinase [Thiospirochaeta perfilievii]